MQIEPDVFVDKEAEQNGGSAYLLTAANDGRVNVDQRDEKVTDDEYKVNRWADAGNVITPDNDWQKEEFRDRCKHEASKKVQSQAFALVDFVLCIRR